MLRSMPKLNHIPEPSFPLFPFHSALEKLPVEWDNKMKTYFCIMKSTFFFFSEDNLGQTDKVQNHISSQSFWGTFCVGQEKPRSEGEPLTVTVSKKEGEQGIPMGGKSSWDQNSQKCLFVHEAWSHLQSMPALQTETLVGADRQIYRSMNILTH